MSIHGFHDVKPIDDTQCCMHVVKVSSIYIVFRGLVWFEGRIARHICVIFKPGMHLLDLSTTLLCCIVGIYCEKNACKSQDIALIICE